MGLKLKKDFFYDKKQVKTAKLIITLLVIISVLVFFLFLPIGSILDAKKEIKGLKQKRTMLNQTLLMKTAANVKFHKKLNEKKAEKAELIGILKSRSFSDVVDFEKKFQQILDRLGIDTLSVSKNYLSKDSAIDNTQRILTDFNLKGDGLKIAELYNLIENSNELMSIRDSKFNVVKEDTSKLQTTLTVGYYMLNASDNIELVTATDEERLNQIIKSYNQKKNIFEEEVEKKVSHKGTHKIDYAKIYRRRFELVGIATTNNTSSAVIYYNSPKKGLKRLIVAKNKSIILDGKKFNIDVSPITVTIKIDGKLITRLHNSK